MSQCFKCSDYLGNNQIHGHPSQLAYTSQRNSDLRKLSRKNDKPREITPPCRLSVSPPTASDVSCTMNPYFFSSKVGITDQLLTEVSSFRDTGSYPTLLWEGVLNLPESSYI